MIIANDYKTIIAPQESIEKWLAALESGNFKQGHGFLITIQPGEETPSYCCLGVCQKVLNDDVESDELPSDYWLADNKFQFNYIYAKYDDDRSVLSVNSTASAPAVYVTEADIDPVARERFQPQVTIPGWVGADTLNDNGVPFTTIARLIRNHVAYNDEQRQITR